jgi:hypothetical protein
MYQIGCKRKKNEREYEETDERKTLVLATLKALH